MKFYQAEREAFEFCNKHHTLQEWADYGFNAVVCDGKQYWDGKLDGYKDINIDAANTTCALDFYDYDEDGYRIPHIRVL